MISRTGLTATMLLALAIAQPAQSQDGSAEAGRALFALNCATCHGLGARGLGPMAEILAISPPDLTRLSAGGSFPLADVVRRIDGRDMILSHGGPMPIFGHILEDRSAVVDDADGTPVFTSQTVLDIAAYLETVQR